ncbi:MAG: CBS domain-containing protein [Desulfobacterales bacterium]|jgi:tRNA nucleotidyltransferase (CCA-adding enzyme)
MAPGLSTQNGLTVITTHLNADFDAMASMLAAQKLYPEAVVVFPGSHEKNLRNFFIQSMVYLFNMADIKDIVFESVKRLVLVDTRHRGRIGPLGDLLALDPLEIHIYDHHPASENDIAGDMVGHDLTGANVTLIVEEIRRRGIEISADEATIMCLGIYEDTGSFTFPSTTDRDLEIAAFLVSKGANLNTISSLISRELTPGQVGLLNDMFEASVRHPINGIDVVVTSVTTDDYMPDFALLVHKMIRMEDLDAVFAIARMQNKIYIVGRSRVPEVDASAIISPFGGGGHPYAAAATVKHKTLAQTEHDLIDILYRSVRSKRHAAELMSAPPIAVDIQSTCKTAAQLLTRYNINALLVQQTIDGRQELVGYITRQVIEKALYHDLGGVGVGEYANTEYATVGMEADIEEIQEKIIENKQRILPVMEGRTIKGVITRTDLLNLLVRRQNASKDRSIPNENHPVHARTRTIRKFMEERLSERVLAILTDIGKTAETFGWGAYVVGGFVRDLYLYRPTEDMDIVIEGDGIRFARSYSEKVGARVHSHAKFGTAVITFPNGDKVDVASARMEYYQFPAALPTVEMSSIKLDLFRRDFTINTLAIQLNPGRFGTLIDFFSAFKDIKERHIRVLHNLSFVEDPTRAFRAIRFEQRFGFSIGKLTKKLIQNAVDMDFFNRLSGRRILSELKHILSEDNPTPAMGRLDDFDLLKAIHPAIQWDTPLEDRFNSTRKVVAWYDLLFLEDSYMKWAVYFMGVLHGMNRETANDIGKRLELTPRLLAIFCKERLEAERSLFRLENRIPKANSALFHVLKGFRTEVLLFMMSITKSEAVRRSISRYCLQLRHVTPEISGNELKSLGLSPGPIYREILDAIRDMKLNGKLESRGDELAFVKEKMAIRQQPEK